MTNDLQKEIDMLRAENALLKEALAQECVCKSAIYVCRYCGQQSLGYECKFCPRPTPAKERACHGAYARLRGGIELCDCTKCQPKPPEDEL